MKNSTMAKGEAILSNSGEFTSFEFGDYVVRFKTSPWLECYTEIKDWDNGFITVTAKYSTTGEVEDYIDLTPILKNLYIDADEFLKPIKKIRIKNLQSTEQQTDNYTK